VIRKGFNSCSKGGIRKDAALFCALRGKMGVVYRREQQSAIIRRKTTLPTKNNRGHKTLAFYGRRNRDRGAGSCSPPAEDT
ncbi:MAG: hypothetical protein ACERKO_03745, partial [Acetanaerobacterium sp.]